MGWAENRIRDYQSGDRASWLERRMLEHANPVHFPMALAASAGLAYGLWRRSWPWILGSSALALSGHAYCWTHPARKTYRVLAGPAEQTAVARAG